MSASSTRVALWLDPLSYHLEQDRLFDPANTPTSGERILEPYVRLRERLAALGVPVHTGDTLVRGDFPPAELNLYATMGLRSRYRRLARRGDTILSAFLVNECPVAEPRIFDELHEADALFRRLYSFAGDEAMRPFLRAPLRFQPFRYPYPFNEVDPDAWSHEGREFLAIINGNKVPRIDAHELYSERLRALAFFEARGEIDLYGVGWAGPPFRVGETAVPRVLRRLGYLAEASWQRLRPDRDPLLSAARRAWRGAVVSKRETLSRYEFAICFENMVMEGWVTEKIFDCLVAGAIPVYLGAPDIERWVDPACFIDMRDFGNYDELRAYLLSLGPSERALYREAGRDYFASAMFRPFTADAFADIFVKIAVEDAGLMP